MSENHQLTHNVVRYSNNNLYNQFGNLIVHFYYRNRQKHDCHIQKKRTNS